MDLTDGHLRSTDYWTCDEGARSGRCWLSVHASAWHLLMPVLPVSLKISKAIAMPVIRRDSEAGWQWAVWLTPKMDLRIPLECILGPAPPLPEPGSQSERTLLLYDHFLPGLSEQVTHSFGHFHPGTVPVARRARLLITRPPRRR